MGIIKDVERAFRWADGQASNAPLNDDTLRKILKKIPDAVALRNR